MASVVLWDPFGANQIYHAHFGWLREKAGVIMGTITALMRSHHPQGCQPIISKGDKLHQFTVETAILIQNIALSVHCLHIREKPSRCKGHDVELRTRDTAGPVTIAGESTCLEEDTEQIPAACQSSTVDGSMDKCTSAAIITYREGTRLPIDPGLYVSTGGGQIRCISTGAPHWKHMMQAVATTPGVKLVPVYPLQEEAMATCVD